MKKFSLLICLCFILASTFFISCSAEGEGEIYIGRLETETVLISSQAAGEILDIAVREGDLVSSDQYLVRIDSENLKIQKRQQLSRLNEIEARKISALHQIDQARTRLNLNRDTLDKTEKLLAKGAATVQRRDELAAQVSIEQSNLEMLQSNFNLILAREEELQAVLDMTDLAIRRSSIHSPIEGTVLNRFRNKGELVAVGTPLLELADLSVLDLYVYLPLRKLPEIKIGQTVSIIVTGLDEPIGGTVQWIASQGEFTPKSILTGETRDTLVYEVRIRVENVRDELKIGMPVDVSF